MTVLLKNLGFFVFFSFLFIDCSQAGNADIVPDHLASVYLARSELRHRQDDSKALYVFFFKDGKSWREFEPKQGLFKRDKRESGTLFDFVGPKHIAENEYLWTAFFDGRKLGQITSKWVKEFKNSSAPRIHEVIDIKENSPFPKRWILLSSHADISDPQEWKVGKSDSQTIKLVKDKFRKMYPDEYKCLDSSDGYGGSEKTGKRLKVADLEILKTYRSKDGQQLLGVQKRVSCGEDHYSTSDHWLQNWILVKKDKTTRLLNVGGEVVEAADLDQDGISEWIFVTVDYADYPHFSLVTLHPASEATCCGPY